MDTSRLAVLIAMQRSGTHFLGSAIGSHPDVKYTGEIFCRNVPRDKSRMVAGIERVQCGGFEVVCLDVKYNQISPPVEAILPDVRAVIHLIRRDRLAHYFSGELHSWRGRNPNAEKGFVPTFDFSLSHFNALNYRTKWGFDKFRKYETVRLVYEDLTAGRQTDTLPDWASEKICKALGVEFAPLEAGTVKSAPVRYLEYLRNVPPEIVEREVVAGWGVGQ